MPSAGQRVDGHSGMTTFEPSRRRRGGFLPLLVLLTLLAGLGAGAAGAMPELKVKQPKYRAPELVFEGPPRLEPQIERLRALDPRPLADIAELLDLEDPGPPIRVLVVPEGAEETRIAPSWAVGYALSEIGLVVLMPSRVPAYPDGDLAEVLRHEVAHVLIARAAGRQPLPRFLDEGLAVVAARGWQLQDRSRLLLAVWPLGGKDLPALREDFGGGAEQAGHAYVISAAFVRFLLDTEGPDAGARILRRIAEGYSFDAAFLAAIGHPLEGVQSDFWAETDVWQKWLPIVFGSTGFTLMITVLVLLAWRRRHRRDEEQRQVWELEEEAFRRAAREELERRAAAAPGPPGPDRTPSGQWIN